MTVFIFAGDMLVTGFMIGLFVWLFLRTDKEKIDAAANIPLEDERRGS